VRHSTNGWLVVYDENAWSTADVWQTHVTVRKRWGQRHERVRWRLGTSRVYLMLERADSDGRHTSVSLPGFTPVAAILESGATLIISRAGGRQSPKLKMPLVEDAISSHPGVGLRAGARGKHQVHHHRSWMPLSRGDPWI
jgi:hypothetical protein